MSNITAAVVRVRVSEWIFIAVRLNNDKWASGVSMLVYAMPLAAEPLMTFGSYLTNYPYDFLLTVLIVFPGKKILRVYRWHMNLFQPIPESLAKPSKFR